jgi:hypothetical protein
MDWGQIKKPALGVLIALIVGASVYTFSGIFTYATNTFIYDAYPERFYCSPPFYEKTLTVRIRNNGSFPFPLFNPSYKLRVTIESDSEAYAYFIGSGGIERNFTDWSLDVGRIVPGDFENAHIRLHPDEGNLSLRVDVYLSVGLDFAVASANYLIDYEGGTQYYIFRID